MEGLPWIDEAGFHRICAIAGTVAALKVVSWMYGAYHSRQRRQSLNAKAATMARDRKAARDAWEKQGLTPSSEARGAAEEDATGLLQLLSSGKLSSEQAMVLACTRAKAVGEALGTNAEECFQEALEEARKCDKALIMSSLCPVLSSSVQYHAVLHHEAILHVHGHPRSGLLGGCVVPCTDCL